MKNSIIKVVAGIGFLMLLAITIAMSSNQISQSGDISLENLAALSEAQAEGSSTACSFADYQGCTDVNGNSGYGKDGN